MKRFSIFISTLVAAFGLLFLPMSVVSAQSTKDVCAGVGAASGSGSDDCTPSGGITDINKVIQVGLRIFQVIVGMIAFVMMLVAGLRFITSGGDSAKVTSARNTLIYAAVGIVVVALSELIIQFVLNRVK